MTTTTTRSLAQIAAEIKADPAYARTAWCAGPYVDAMYCLTSIDDRLGYDSGRSIVLYALSNLQQWRGDTARRIKAELKTMLKEGK